jgi:predicted transcriptional regulator
LDGELIVSIAISALALFLLAISIDAYRRNRRRRLLYIISAFLLFAVEGLIHVFSEILLPGAEWIEPLANLLDLGILLLFFLGVVKE